MGFLINKKAGLVYEVVQSEEGVRDVLLLKIEGGNKGKWECMVGVVYFDVEGRMGNKPKGS